MEDTQKKRGRPKKVAEQKSVPSEQGDVLGRVVSMLETMNARISQLETVKEAAPFQGKSIPQETKFVPNTLLSPGAIETQLHQYVQEILGPEFGMELHYDDGTGRPVFSIVVPEKYSSLPEEIRKSFLYQKGITRDLRTKVIKSVTEGKSWCEKVKKNIFTAFEKKQLASPFQQ